jgi:prevent-host-death family protein
MVPFIVMNQVSYQHLKQHLSETLDRAEKGESILISRHNRPCAMLIAAGNTGVHVGKQYGQGVLAPAIKSSTGGRYLSALADDRAAEP